MYRRTRKYQKNITRQAEKQLNDELSSSSIVQPVTTGHFQNYVGLLRLQTMTPVMW